MFQRLWDMTAYHWWLFIVAVLGVAAAAGSYVWKKAGDHRERIISERLKQEREITAEDVRALIEKAVDARVHKGDLKGAIMDIATTKIECGERHVNLGEILAKDRANYSSMNDKVEALMVLPTVVKGIEKRIESMERLLGQAVEALIDGRSGRR